MGTVVSYPGHQRVTELRARLAKMRHDTYRALAEIDALHKEVDGLREELRSLIVTVGDQMAFHTAALERLQKPGPATTTHAQEAN